ncbi:hypothetical protein BX070DRAFT_230581, partial [Coemansia spiralis]
MYINDLPELVISSILSSTCQALDYNPLIAPNKPEIWKSKLSLLAVCRKWRVLGLSMVHRTSSIVCTPGARQDGMDERENAVNMDKSRQSSNNTVTRSNLDIIFGDETRQYPRHLFVHILCSMNPTNDLCTLVENLYSYSPILQRVRYLKMCFGLDGDGWNVVRVFREGTDKGRVLGQQFATLLPNVSSIMCYNANNGDIGFIESAIQSYLPQLTNIKIPHGALKDVSEFSENVQHMWLDSVPGEPKYLPRTCTKNLQSLYLEQVDQDFTWSSFASSANPRILEFSDLRNLRIRYSSTPRESENGIIIWEAPAYGFNYKVNAPKLDNLNVQLCPYTLSFIASIAGTKTINQLKINIDDRATIDMSNFKLRPARGLFASYARNSNEDTESIDWQKYTNDLFNISELAVSSSLTINSSTLVDVAQVDWPYLKNLQINSEVAFADLVRLVFKLQSLTTLIAINVDVASGGRDFLMLLDDTLWIESLSNSIRTVVLGFKGECQDGLKKSIGRYLYKRMPSLEHLV